MAALRGEPVGSVCGGGAHSLAVPSTGELYAWGAANHHQLGIPEAAEEKPPQLNAPRCVFLDQRVVHAAAGATMSVCVTEGGAVYTWGEGLHGELGHGAATTSLPSPVAVARLWGLRVASVAVGSHHCVARLRNGQLMAWGDNRHGQLGLGAKLSGSGESLSVPTPIDLPGGKPCRLVVAGTTHTLALCAGAAFGAGRNAEGQLGIAEKGASTTRAAFVEARALKGVRFLAAAAGGAMSVVVGSGGGDGGDAPTAKEAWFAVSKQYLKDPHALVTLQTLSRLLVAPARAAKQRPSAEQQQLLQLAGALARRRGAPPTLAALADVEWEATLREVLDELETEGGRTAWAYARIFDGRARREADASSAAAAELSPSTPREATPAPAAAPAAAPAPAPRPPAAAPAPASDWAARGEPVDASAPRRYRPLPPSRGSRPSTLAATGLSRGRRPTRNRRRAGERGRGRPSPRRPPRRRSPRRPPRPRARGAASSVLARWSRAAAAAPSTTR